MLTSHPPTKRIVQLLSRVAFFAGLATAVIVYCAGSADAASFEQVKLFEGPGGGSKLAGVSGMAVNISGAGGAPEPGTVYAVAGNKLLRFSPTGSFQAVVREVSAEYVAVDQSDGDIYVLGSNHVTILTAAGSIIEEFGTRVFGEPANSIEATPESFHQEAGLAVGSDGTVYVGDVGYAPAESPQRHRVMVFKPQSPTDHTNYVYAGRANDIATGPAYSVSEVSIDADDNLYVAADQSIYEFAKGEPDTPVCEYSQPKGGIRAMSVDPENGEVFYLSYKDGQGHQLVCNAEGRFFEPVAPFTIIPKPTSAVRVASVFNPARTYSPDRPPGVLYAASESGLGYIFAPPPLELKPVVESESVSRVTTSTATLGALINPEGTQASYHFQYISDAAYLENDPGERFVGAVEAPIGGAPLGSARDPITAAVAISGLSPDTTYHYRAIASVLSRLSTPFRSKHLVYPTAGSMSLSPRRRRTAGRSCRSAPLAAVELNASRAPFSRTSPCRALPMGTPWLTRAAPSPSAKERYRKTSTSPGVPPGVG
jgi:hypothetical protein